LNRTTPTSKKKSSRASATDNAKEIQELRSEIAALREMIVSNGAPATSGNASTAILNQKVNGLIRLFRDLAKTFITKEMQGKQFRKIHASFLEDGQL